MQGFYLFPAIFLAPIIPRMSFHGLKHKAFSIIQDTLYKVTDISAEEFFLMNGDWYVEAQGNEYPISEKVEIYIIDGNTWLKGERGLTQVLADGYDLTIYYDRNPSDGGQVRIIVASAND